MKRTLLSLLVLGMFSLTLQSQNCDLAKKSNCSSLATKHCNYSGAAMLATLDDNILSVFDTEVMKTKYLRKQVCENSGSVSFDEVRFDHQAGQFVSAKEYKCDWKQCLKNPNCSIQPMSSAKADKGAVAVALESRQKRT